MMMMIGRRGDSERDGVVDDGKEGTYASQYLGYSYSRSR
jgi:hypothetical protein